MHFCSWMVKRSSAFTRDNFIQLYDCLVIFTRKYQQNSFLKVLTTTQSNSPSFFKENVKKLESKRFQDKTYVKANVLPSMKKTKLLSSSRLLDVLHAACTSPPGLGLQGKRKCNHIGGVLFAIEEFIHRGLQNNPELLTCTSRLSVWVAPCNQSVAAKPVGKVLIRKIMFGKKNIRTQPKIINFDPRAPQEQICDDESFKNPCGALQNCLPASSFFLFHNFKS